MKRRRLILLFVCGAVAFVVACFLIRQREPSYHGVSLTAWLCAYDSLATTGRAPSPQQKQEAAEAVRHIGTNALPCLLKWMRYEPAPWRKQWRNAFDKMPHPLNRPGRLSDSAFGLKWELRNQLARDGFEILGREATSAVPELFQMARQGASTRLKNDARFALMDIGTVEFPSPQR